MPITKTTSGVKRKIRKTKATPTQETIIEEDVIEWVFTLREIFQELQHDTIEHAHFHVPSNDEENYQNDLTTSEKIQQTTLWIPTIRQLERLYYQHVVDLTHTDGIAEDEWEVFLNELWFILQRILIATSTIKTIDIILKAISSVIGLFLHIMTTQTSSKYQPPSTTPTLINSIQTSIHQLQTALLSRLMDATEANDKTVRVRACEVLQRIVNTTDVTNDKCFNTIKEKLLSRTQDKLVTVRLQSILALQRFQDQQHQDTDQITSELVRLLISDPSKDVRKLALSSIKMTSHVYPELVRRVRDIDEQVRARAFQVLEQHVSFYDLTISDRILILQQGLQDRSLIVRTACEQLIIRKWMGTTLESFLRFLQALDVEQNTKLCSQIIQFIFKTQTLEYPRDGRDGIHMFLWYQHCLIASIDEREQFIPSISYYLELLQQIQQQENRIFILQQFFALGHFLDFQNEYGRTQLLIVLKTMVSDITIESQLIEGIMGLLAKIHGVEPQSGSSQNEFIRVMAEIMSDLYDQQETPDISETSSLTEQERLQAETRFEQLEQQLQVLETQDGMESEEYIEIQTELEQLEKILQDPKILAWLRCLEILSHVFQLTSTTIHHPILSGVGRYILPAIECDVPAIRETGLECLGHYCLLDRTMAQQYLVVFWRVLQAQEEEKDVKMTCLRAVFDILFSYSQFECTHVSMESIYQGLFQYASSMINDQDWEGHELIMQGFSKLYLLRRMECPIMLSHLLETLFHQTLILQSSCRSLQLLSVFFPCFVQSSTRHCHLLEQAMISILHQSLDKDVMQCFKFVVHLLRSEVKAHSKCGHGNRLGLNLCIDVLAFEELYQDNEMKRIETHQKKLIKILLMSEISAADSRSAMLLLTLLHQVDVSCRKHLRLGTSVEIFHKRLTASYALDQRDRHKRESIATSCEHEQEDQEWARQQIQARKENLQSMLHVKTQRNQRQTSRRCAESTSDSAESESEEESNTSTPPVRARSSRQSMVRAVESMRARKVVMKIAFEDDEEDDDDEDDDEIESEQSDDEDEENHP